MITYAIYTRKSHDDKKLTEKSTGEQLAECLAIAERDSLRVAWSCEESKSAKTPRVRLKYNELIKLIERGKVDGILCWHVNRLVRNMEEGGKLVQLLIEGRIREIRTPHATYRSGDNILPVVLEAASATQYSLDLGNVVARSMEGNFRAGGCNYKAPPGYMNVRDPLNSKRGMVEPDPVRFTVIQKAWRDFISGNHNVNQIWRDLNNAGFRMRASLNMPERPISYFAVLAMFRNPFYAGYVCRRGEIVKGRHQAMVSVSEFDRVQKTLARRSFAAIRIHRHRYAGLMRCGYCGQQVTAETKKLRTGPWEVYHCSDSYERCTQKGLSLAALEGQFLDLLISTQLSAGLLALVADSIARGLEKASANVRDQAAHHQSELERIDRRQKRLIDMWISGLLDDEERFHSLEKELANEKRQLTLHKDSQSGDLAHMLGNIHGAKHFLTSAADRFRSATPEGRKQILQAMGEITFFGREKRIELKMHPILAELTKYAHYVQQLLEPLEPTKTESGNKEKEALLEPLFLGRADTSQLEPPQSLMKALADQVLPELPDSDIGDTVVRMEEVA